MASDLITSSIAAIVISWAGVAVMVIAFLVGIGIHTRRRHGIHPRR